MNKFIILIVAILILVGGVYFYNATNKARQQNFGKVTVRLAWLHQAQFSGFYVAKEKGFYKEAGLDVELKEYEDGLDILQELNAGKVQFSVATPLEILTAIERGDNVKAIAVIYQTAPLAFASLSSANITTPADFRGKILGAKGGNNEAKVKYQSLLSEYNIPEQAVSLKELDYSMSEADDLLNKRVDVIDMYRTDQPYLFKQKGVTINLLLPENFGISGYGDTLLTTESLIGDKPELVESFVQATLKGWEYALDNKTEALTIVAKYQNKDYADPERQKYILDQSAPLIRPTGGRTIGDMNFRIWDQIVKQAQSAGLISNEFDSTTVYTNQFLQ